MRKINKKKKEKIRIQKTNDYKFNQIYKLLYCYFGLNIQLKYKAKLAENKVKIRLSYFIYMYI